MTKGGWPWRLARSETRYGTAAVESLLKLEEGTGSEVLLVDYAFRYSMMNAGVAERFSEGRGLPEVGPFAAFEAAGA